MKINSAKTDISMAALGLEAPIVTVSEKPTNSEVSALKKHVAAMLHSECYIRNIGLIDLRNARYQGGTTLSSGYLPKWDIYDIFIKVCSLHPTGQWRSDSLYESYAMDLFADSGVKVAEAVPAYVVFFNTETQKDEVRLCEVAVKFSGALTYYRDLKRTYEYGRYMNDELIDFTDRFPDAKIGLLNMFVVVYIMNQEDRHSKNLGVLDDGSFAPLYDNGSSLYYTVPDEWLVNGVEPEGVAQVKFLSKAPDIAIRRYGDWFNAKPSVDLVVVLKNLDTVEKRYEGMMRSERMRHNRNLIERRIALCMEILS